jgi:hypothetical protein
LSRAAKDSAHIDSNERTRQWPANSTGSTEAWEAIAVEVEVEVEVTMDEVDAEGVTTDGEGEAAGAAGAGTGAGTGVETEAEEEEEPNAAGAVAKRLGRVAKRGVPPAAAAERAAARVEAKEATAARGRKRLPPGERGEVGEGGTPASASAAAAAATAAGPLLLLPSTKDARVCLMLCSLIDR